MANILTVYYSRKGQNYWGGSIKNQEKGNTEILAEAIQAAVGGDIFEVDTVKPYAEDYHTCTEEAAAELKANARPRLKAYMENLDSYDTIFVGFPNWWGTMPMPVFSFLERYDLNGKRIIPFCTNEGSGMGRSERDLKSICTGARVEKGLAVRGTECPSFGRKAADWARRMTDKN